jgi:IS30 family transposase
MRKETNSPERELRTFRIYFFIQQTTINRNRNGGEDMAGNYRYLDFEDRKKIEAWHARGDRPLEIAARLGVHTATIYHELQRGYTGEVDAAQREVYSAERAQAVVRENFKRRGRRSVNQ